MSRLAASVLAGASLLLVTQNLCSQVVINETMAAASGRRVSWGTNGRPHLGSGKQWMEAGFTETGWFSANVPAGYGFLGLATNLQSAMKDLAPSLYLRKSFNMDPALLSSTNPVVLSMQFNDGFVAYLNGREIARANCGPTNHLLFAQMPAYNINANPAVIDYVVRDATNILQPGQNILAIQAHNAERLDSTSTHIMTSEFRVDAGLRILSGDTNIPDATLISTGPAGGTWRMFMGRWEPSGGVTDPGLATRTFVPPVGEESDFETPAQFADWVELHNRGDSPVDISGWMLSDDPQSQLKWRFPAKTVIPARGFLVVLCDDRDESNAPLGPATKLHTTFKLADDGEPLVLYDAQGVFVDGFSRGYPPQTFHASYGRHPDTSFEMVYLQDATPGAANSGPAFPGMVMPPDFRDAKGNALSGGVYTNTSLSLAFRLATPGAKTYYTVDGSEPGPAAALYTGPITITQPNLKTGVVIRAQSRLPGWLPSKTVTRTFILQQPPLLKKYPLLALSGTPGRTFYAPQGILAISGGVMNNSVWNPNGPGSYNMALGSGDGYERECSIEAFFPNRPAPSLFRTDGGARLSASPWQRPRMALSQPATTSPWPVGDVTQKPSLNLYFDGDYGDGSLEFQIFTNSPISKYRHLRLRAGKNDSYNPFIIDEFMRRLWLDLGHAGARGMFCSLYVNAVYKGVYNVCERLRESFFQEFYQNDSEWDVCYSGDWVNGDASAQQRLLTMLEYNLNIQGTWQSLTNLIDVDNAADYFLLNIYGSTWDWPGNNYAFARPRSAGPEGRFRFAVWDAEGAFAIVTSQKPVNYNIIANELLVAQGNPNYNALVARIFRRLCTSAEFRLRFADHVNRHMFNQGVLDDRDPDGAGPLKSRFRARLDELVSEAGDLVRYNTGQGINTNPFMAWANPINGRRSFLLGSTAGRQMLRDAGLWPRTEPPVFSQHGGMVAPGFSLSITSTVATVGHSAVIYYTTNGVDPRRMFSGALHPDARLYSEPIPLDGVQTITARAWNTTNSDWSALTAATFATGAVPATSNNLAVAEIMYNPPNATLAEIAAGFFDADDFEFARLRNIGRDPVDLSTVRWTQGVIFDYATGSRRFLGPLDSVLVVKNRAAFTVRYGASFAATIAGEFAGNLSNGGERINLSTGGGAIIRDFTYLDQSPWPEAPDGAGFSLLLAEPLSNPDHASPANWIASGIPGGTPAVQPSPMIYGQWKNMVWNRTSATNLLVSGDSADPDHDFIPNYAEYVFGLHPLGADTAPRIEVSQLPVDSGGMTLLLHLQLNGGVAAETIQWERMTDSGEWGPQDGVTVVESTSLVSGRKAQMYQLWVSPEQLRTTLMLRPVLRF